MAGRAHAFAAEKLRLPHLFWQCLRDTARARHGGVHTAASALSAPSISRTITYVKHAVLVGANETPKSPYASRRRPRILAGRRGAPVGWAGMLRYLAGSSLSIRCTTVSLMSLEPSAPGASGVARYFTCVGYPQTKDAISVIRSSSGKRRGHSTVPWPSDSLSVPADPLFLNWLLLLPSRTTISAPPTPRGRFPHPRTVGHRDGCFERYRGGSGPHHGNPQALLLRDVTTCGGRWCCRHLPEKHPPDPPRTGLLPTSELPLPAELTPRLGNEATVFFCSAPVGLLGLLFSYATKVKETLIHRGARTSISSEDVT